MKSKRAIKNEFVDLQYYFCGLIPLFFKAFAFFLHFAKKVHVYIK